MIIRKIDAQEPVAAKKLRVAAYCRVSTENADQKESLEAQKTHYETWIKRHSDWEFAGVFYDFGISGTKADSRDGLQALLYACRTGSIDYVLTKSISRFSRNTADCLSLVRELLSCHIPIYFEKENIDTGSMDSELILSIMASLAQQESESLSKNTKMGIHYRFQQGKVMVNARNFLGYDKDENGHLIINPEQAEIVKRIFREYLEGKSCKKIAQGLERDGILTSRGKAKWHDTSIRKILENEKYMGDALLQKTCTVDFLNKKRVKNTGMQPQYYVEDDHEVIIPKEIFLMVQEEMARRSEQNACFGRRKNFSANHPFSKIVFCAECGEEFRRIHWNNRGKKSVVWRCLTRLKQKDQCHARTVSEETLIEAFIDALNEIVGNSDDYMTRLKENLETAINEVHPESAAALAAKMAKLQQELIDRTERRENYDDITEEILRMREQQAQTAMDDNAKSEHKKRIRELLKFIERQKSKVLVFDGSLVKKLLEKVTVYDDYMEFRFKSGVTVSVEK